MAWSCLVIAGLMEAGRAVGLKNSRRFSRLAASVITVVLLAENIWLLPLALSSLPMGTACAAWTGIGPASALHCRHHRRRARPWRHNGPLPLLPRCARGGSGPRRSVRLSDSVPARS